MELRCAEYNQAGVGKFNHMLNKKIIDKLTAVKCCVYVILGFKLKNVGFLQTKNDSISFYCWCVVLNFTQLLRAQHFHGGHERSIDPVVHATHVSKQHFNDMQLWEVLHVCSVEILLNSRQLVVDVFKHPNTMHFYIDIPFKKL